MEKGKEDNENESPPNIILIVNKQREILYSLFRDSGEYIGGKQFDSIKRKYFATTKEANEYVIVVTNSVERCIERMCESNQEEFNFLDGKQMFFNLTR